MALAEERHCHEMATTAAMVAEKAIAQLAVVLAEMVSTAEQGRHEAATGEKVLADEANKQRWAAALEKALANDANEQRQAAVQEKVLADEANKQHQAAGRDKALADEANERAPPTAVSPPPHHPTMCKDAVLSTMGGSLCAKSLLIAPLSCPSTTVDGQLQTACCRSQPCRRVGRRHGPRAPNPQEDLLPGRQHWPRAPNQSTENGWA
jgi:hypothetical protein